MNNTLKVSVNKEYNFDVTEEQMLAADAVSLDQENFHVLHNNTSYHAKVVNTDFINKTYTVVVNNNEYVVSIANHLDQLIKEMGFEVGKAKVVNAIKAPMPGLILEINVTVGQEVNEGDNLLILEAMKMENSFDSPRAGIIKSIAVTKGQAVEKGQLLIEFE
ncbi:MAG: acetyl-CoA carboxylase biotin carboxyl carrier protein subunit [Myroides sp.]|jgi:biotin carboxyl carrier protein|uniref:Acetyl-CoA carboxylase biotin carboxyl carrier protein subunit n=1 Tax=Paenimyroides baculatum TaxID=2608000 RepID=A0A5M6CI01_9FLAO|nr:acetyl-CoA carboxylase biotin carboxyl carrier protein subunit [Paenimyroides baculatum]KAA5534060.1 acetyl-CoA carboxylase biotin carboxyl carrier protein subunit [Paenimyroides baculatum]